MRDGKVEQDVTRKKTKLKREAKEYPIKSKQDGDDEKTSPKRTK